MINSSQELILKNSFVYDAKNKINGEKKDLLISNGKIVNSLNNEQTAKEIDATDCITFPGLIDVRSHFFAQETSYHQLLSKTHKTRLDHSTVMDVEQAALSHGFTFFCEMDVPVTQSKIALYNMHLSPFLDHAMIMDIGSNWSFLTDFESESSVENIGNTISLLLGLIKGFGISTNCPYHQLYWKLDEIPHNSKIPMIPLNALQIFNLLTKAAVKNSIFPHFVSPYQKENASVNHMETLQGIKQNNYTLSTSNQYFLENFSDLTKFHASNEQFTCEITPFTLGNTYPLITRDRNLALRESKTSGVPMRTIDLEFDTEYYVTARTLGKKHPYLDNWIELIHCLKKDSNLNRIILSSNAPYHMGISDWPTHISNLITRSSNEISLLDISSLLSANPAKLLNIGNRKGHLGAGADADIVCFKVDPEEINSTSFADTAFVVKSGILLKKNSQIVNPTVVIGKIYWSQGKFDKNSMERTKKRMESFYNKRFSMHLTALETKETPTMEKL